MSYIPPMPKTVLELPAPETMTLRDWFAGQALTGVLRDVAKTAWDAGDIAETAYLVADEMLKERVK